MVSVLIADRVEQEAKQLADCCRTLTARFTEEELCCEVHTDKKSLKGLLAGTPGGDINCLDLTIEDGIQLAEKVRTGNQQAFILLVTTQEMSPMLYLRPSIMAGSLLLRPFTREDAVRNLAEAYRFHYRNQERQKDQDCFKIENRGAQERIVYSEIRYFEARAKQITLVTAVREYTFYDTMDNLEETLPNQFVRCHRSFIVNKNYILRAKYAENLLYLEGEEPIPLSRSYKTAIKEILK